MHGSVGGWWCNSTGRPGAYKIEFWQHGNRLGDVDGMRLIAEHYPEIVDAITNQRSNAKTNED